MTSSICLSLVFAKTLFFLSDFLYKLLLEFARCQVFLNCWMPCKQSLLCQESLAAGSLLGASVFLPRSNFPMCQLSCVLSQCGVFHFDII